MKDHVIIPHIADNRSELWTNNNCESLNFVIKNSINWKPKKMPELIDMIKDQVDIQMLNLRRSLRGRGDYILREEYKKKYFIPEHAWQEKDDEAKGQLFSKFLGVKCIKNSTSDREVIHATGSSYSISAVPAIAKKPGQRKRIRSDRTHPRSK